ncbi:MAG TPA: NUDIX domain-containing protein [Armatimonadota bacterium]|jgi:8-oxo-dGTP diphosphatase
MDRLSLVSAGAVVLAATDPPQVALLRHATAAEWRLPKGKLDPGETPREAAVREVREETGLVVTVSEEIGRSDYDYEDKHGRAIGKTVWFFLARLPEAEKLTPEQPTFDEARWVSPREAETLLTWDNERDMVRQALTVWAEKKAEA